jgi:hypothetical protein
VYPLSCSLCFLARILRQFLRQILRPENAFQDNQSPKMLKLKMFSTKLSIFILILSYFEREREGFLSEMAVQPMGKSDWDEFFHLISEDTTDSKIW